jgi:hypothetical protein
MTYNVKDKGTKHLIDSLEKQVNEREKTISDLTFKLTLEKERTGAAVENRNSILDALKTAKTNTTVVVKGAERDTIKNK